MARSETKPYGPLSWSRTLLSSRVSTTSRSSLICLIECATLMPRSSSAPHKSFYVTFQRQHEQTSGVFGLLLFTLSLLCRRFCLVGSNDIGRQLAALFAGARALDPSSHAVIFGCEQFAQRLDGHLFRLGLFCSLAHSVQRRECTQVSLPCQRGITDLSMATLASAVCMSRATCATCSCFSASSRSCFSLGPVFRGFNPSLIRRALVSSMDKAVGAWPRPVESSSRDRGPRIEERGGESSEREFIIGNAHDARPWSGR